MPSTYLSTKGLASFEGTYLHDCELECEYGILPAEPDVGLMSEYAELGTVRDAGTGNAVKLTDTQLQELEELLQSQVDFGDD